VARRQPNSCKHWSRPRVRAERRSIVLRPVHGWGLNRSEMGHHAQMAGEVHPVDHEGGELEGGEIGREQLREQLSRSAAVAIFMRLRSSVTLLLPSADPAIRSVLWPRPASSAMRTCRWQLDASSCDETGTGTC
jgi:hypothetical protein